MGQRKLTKEETELVGVAKGAIGQLSVQYKMYETLRDMLYHGTTDGKPYVEPQPDIPEGYRAAAEGDEERRDRMYWESYSSEWAKASCMFYATGTHFIVPVDRIPTDDDARERPLVMVRDFDDTGFHKATLLAVTPADDYPFTVLTWNQVHKTSWKQCRFPYPGE